MKVYLIKNLNENKTSWKESLINILVRDYQMDKKKIEFYNNEYGKPYLLNSKIYFNISHSGKLLAIGISSDEVGVDIELVQERKYQDDVVKRTFNEKEQEIYNGNKQVTYFYDVWTKKEAYVKLIGTGIRNMFKDLPIEYDEVIITKKIHYLDNDYYLSLATNDKNERNNIEIIYE